MADNGFYRCYVEKKFRAESLALIGQANKIIDEYEQQGFSLTLRQLYYQFVARGMIPNTPTSYNNLGSLINDARLAGLVSWLAIEDRTRALQGINHVDGPGTAVRNARIGYARDLWHDQDMRPEVWVEKEALVGVIGHICAELRVDFFACRGYNSQSEQWRAGRRFANYYQRGQRPIVFHLGDHDPSGIDMTRDNRDRLSMFAGAPVQVVRLALNYDQVEEHEPPPNPAKMTDSRAADYVSKFGDSSWELDALPPTIIADLIRDAVERVRDEERWDLALKQEVDDKNSLDIIIEELGGKPVKEGDRDDQ